jgi:hypothetical protein
MPQFDQEKMVKLVSELRKSVARFTDIAKLPQGYGLWEKRVEDG